MEFGSPNFDFDAQFSTDIQPIFAITDLVS